jgi:hypothetical protein
MGAVIRHQLGERQASQRLNVSALVDRVMGVAIAVAHSVAVATKATLWPCAIIV